MKNVRPGGRERLIIYADGAITPERAGAGIVAVNERDQVVLIANLQDLSTMWAPSFSWSATEWLTLTAYGFLPVPGPDALAVRTPAGTPVTEYGSLPFAWRALFEARVFY